MDIDWCMDEMVIIDEERPSERPITPPLPTYDELLEEMNYLMDRLANVKKLMKFYNIKK